MKCDICGYEHETAVSLCNDGVIRCKLCRHRAKYGRVLHTAQEYAEHKDDPTSPFDVAPAQPDEGQEGAAALEMTARNNLSDYQAKLVRHG
jgi:hypothetical protein